MPVQKTYEKATSTWHETASTSDADAIHDNVAGEIAAIPEKVTPVNADVLVIEDSEAADAKKRVQMRNVSGLPARINHTFLAVGDEVTF